MSELNDLQRFDMLAIALQDNARRFREQLGAEEFKNLLVQLRPLRQELEATSTPEHINAVAKQVLAIFYAHPASRALVDQFTHPEPAGLLRGYMGAEPPMNPDEPITAEEIQLSLRELLDGYASLVS